MIWRRESENNSKDQTSGQGPTGGSERFCQPAAGTRFLGDPAPFILVTACFFIGFLFMRPNLGEPDSYREALSALRYIHEGIYSSYWDHPLTMYLFVAATRLARAFDAEDVRVLNTVAVSLGAASIWPFFRLVSELVNRRTALFATASLIVSPVFIRFSGYLSHEIAGFAGALWSLYLFERTLTKRSRSYALAAGLCFAATWAARPNSAMFIAPPLIVLIVCGRNALRELLDVTKLLLFAVLGSLICLLLVYRPALVDHLASFSGAFLARFYEFGRYTKSTSMIALESLTPVLVALTALGLVALLRKRRLFVALFAGSWILTAYLFYTGMYSMHRYFLALAPPCLLLCFGGADTLDSRFADRRFGHPTKTCAALLILFGALGPNVPDLWYLSRVNDDRAASEAVGQIVGQNLLFTTSPEPMVRYYNRDRPPETIYLVTEYSPGKVVMDMEALRLAHKRLSENRPVYATGEIIRQLRFRGVESAFELVWEYKGLHLYRVTQLTLDNIGPLPDRREKWENF